MKKAIVFVSALLFLFSCEKEALLEIPKPARHAGKEPSYDALASPQEMESPMNAAKRIMPFEIAIRSSFCYAGGESLTVYNPQSNNSLYFQSPAFHVEWFRGGVLVEKGITLDCACDFEYVAKVIHLASGRTAMLKYRAVPCEQNQ